MKILITGGSGYLGTHVRRFFSADDFSRRSSLDILNPQDLERVRTYDAVIHLAALLDKSPEAADSSFRTNVDGTLNLIRNMQPGSVFIYASTKDVYGRHADSYRDVPETCSTDYSGQSSFEWSKLIGERYVEYYAAKQNVRACIFRMSSVYARPTSGNDNGFVTHYVESIKHGLPIRLPAHGEPTRDVLFVDDFSRACQLFIDSSRVSGLYNLGGGRTNAMTMRGLVQSIGRIIELEPVIVDAALPAPIPFNYVSDLTRIDAELGWQPQIGVYEGIRYLL